MQVCTHRGLVVAVLTRNEHCPPHVHVGSDKWQARFSFSFWHNSVCLWDVVRSQGSPSISLLEEFRQLLRQPVNLSKARRLWWKSQRTVCLQNLHWDGVNGDVVKPKRSRTCAIVSAVFDGKHHQTLLTLVNGETVEIGL